MSTKIDKNGITSNKIVTDDLQTSDGIKYFKETDLDSITINDAAIENATKIAVNAATSTENDATAANTAKLAAETAAENALASSTTAEQAKTDALAAQTKAEEEASKAEQNAALLGDAALQGGNNTFTGLNTFSGETVGLLPWDFFAYSWCKNKAELWAMCPDIEQRTVFCADLSNFEEVTQPNDGDGPIFPQNIQTLVVYYSGNLKGKYTYKNDSKSTDKLVIYAPNATSMSRVRIISDTKEFVFIAPNCKLNVYFFAWRSVNSMTCFFKNTEISESFLTGYGTARERLWRFNCPFNVLKTIDFSNFKVLKEVPVGFPHATYINMNAAKLNKGSVMAILNALQPYNAATMTAVPELTLGIDPTLDGDEEINAALLNAQTAVEDGGKGWNVAVNGFTITAGGATTEGLTPHIYATRKPDAEGVWVAADGTRWSVRYGNTVLENWVANEQLGYEEFATLDDALTLWGLTEYVPPIEEIQENI